MASYTVAVVGAGTMGRGVSLACQSAGMDVIVYDIDSGLARSVVAEILISKSRTPASATAVNELDEAVEAANIVIECVPELPGVKAETLTAIRARSQPGAIVATNTSTMSIAGLMKSSGTRGHLIGLHFFNPAEKMRLVEIVRMSSTPAELTRRSQDFVQALGKTSIVVEDSPGFVTSRLGLIMGNEAMRMVEQGIATADAIDTAMRLGYNHPMGPLELADLVGLDARLNNVRTVYEALGDVAYKPPRILEELVSSGRIGRKAGHGFYDYEPNGRRRKKQSPDTPRETGLGAR